MKAQKHRRNRGERNLGNAERGGSCKGQPYKGRKGECMRNQARGQPGGTNSASNGVKVASITEDQAPMRMVHDPSHPMANKEGYVTMPNVNVVEEMVDMISASRSYQNNVEMMNTAKTLLLKTLTIGQ